MKTRPDYLWFLSPDRKGKRIDKAEEKNPAGIDLGTCIGKRNSLRPRYGERESRARE